MTAASLSDNSWVPPPKFYRIGEVARHSGFSRQTIHNYTVTGLIREDHRTSGQHRMYGEQVFRTLALVKSLKGKKTLMEIREILLARGMIDDPSATGSPSANANS